MSLLKSLIILSLSSIGSATLLPIIGPKHYDVAITSMALTDSSRLDPFAKDNRKRSIMASEYYPVLSCKSRKLSPYMPPATTAFQDEKFGAYGLPAGSFTALELETCNDTNKAKDCPERFPLVLFSGALGTSRLLYGNMLQSIAAAGYVVVSVDHPYDADIVEFPNGTNITAIDLETDADIDLALSTRVADIAFVYQQLNTKSAAAGLVPANLRSSNTAVIGHSLGGAAAASAMLALPYLHGGLNIDGTMFGSVLTAGLARPFMLLGHENKTQATDPSWAAIWPKLSGWKAEYEVKGAAHYSFSDLPIITAALGLQELLPADVEQVLGSVEGVRMQSVTVTYTTAFLDFVLKSGKETALKRAGRLFAEVKKVA